MGLGPVGGSVGHTSDSYCLRARELGDLHPASFPHWLRAASWVEREH